MAVVAAPSASIRMWRGFVRAWRIAQLGSLGLAGVVFLALILEPHYLVELPTWKRLPYLTAPLWPSLARQIAGELKGNPPLRTQAGWSPRCGERAEAFMKRHTHTFAFAGVGVDRHLPDHCLIERHARPTPA